MGTGGACMPEDIASARERDVGRLPRDSATSVCIVGGGWRMFWCVRRPLRARATLTHVQVCRAGGSVVHRA
ncbi:hypothetical protein FA95DRAFT_507377 [Auriscalpium vulgare]|uniref:Uncharacterized protein n=2 Tax=Auriscalpium vulgare TaxID=40419 RepID=A0ACB8RFI7_9AGAM|nr:hypothetical protein FA95DRAFT_956462 [Auriscalpium vulgare]KAI0042941.1 hypothetical protein FA95DRAFT_507377 [Auriscalpium vulgare]